MGQAPSLARDHLAIALDVPTPDEAVSLARAVALHVGVVKVGLELFVGAGPSVVRAVSSGDQRVFLDLKLHDIPETVARAVDRAAALGVSFLTLHAGGGRAMMEAAARAARGSELKLLAVTALTSLDHDALLEVGVDRPLEDHVVGLARLAAASGIDGLVASAREVARLRAELPAAFVVTPGIRPGGKLARDDQARVATPRGAIRDGSSLLVVGRPLRDAPDRAAAARALHDEVAEALG